ncbi:NmrA family NAD(P)-binding protein [Sphaerisporangium sp. NPDC051011]|uniref:NmrA family NAD(P)-binding protein n=1 Tax=Sphaerisporangium sp. NPDC051011 TaxID=3155792 RepID=UPI003401D54D
MNDDRPILISGATGRQGGATARALLAAGVPVRALVRDTESQGARALRTAGAELAKGDLRDRRALEQACQGVRGVFSVQTPMDGGIDFQSERDQGRNLVEAALGAGVGQFVHTSASGVGSHHRAAPGWNEGRWSMVDYFESKAATQELVAKAGFEYWTLVKPPTFMDHAFFQRSAVVDSEIVTAFAPETELPLIAPNDIGLAAAAAFMDPSRFNQVELELAGDVLTVGAIADVLSQIWGERVVSRSLTPDQAKAAGLPEPVVEAQEWLNIVGSPARPAQARSMGLSPIDFRTWATQHYAE